MSTSGLTPYSGNPIHTPPPHIEEKKSDIPPAQPDIDVAEYMAELGEELAEYIIPGSKKTVLKRFEILKKLGGGNYKEGTLVNRIKEGVADSSKKYVISIFRQAFEEATPKKILKKIRELEETIEMLTKELKKAVTAIADGGYRALREAQTNQDNAELNNQEEVKPQESINDLIKSQSQEIKRLRNSLEVISERNVIRYLRERKSELKRAGGDLASLDHIVTPKELKIHDPHSNQEGKLVGFQSSFQSGGNGESLVDGTFSGYSKLSKDEKMKFKLSVARHMTLGPAQMHALKVSHCDIKPDNFLIGLDNKGKLDNVSINDFGKSHIEGDPNKDTTYFIVHCPRNLEGGGGNDKHDSFSLGITLYQLFAEIPTNKLFLNEEGKVSLKLRGTDILDAEGNIVTSKCRKWAGFDEIPLDIQNLIIDLVHHNPNKRISVNEALARIDQIINSSNQTEPTPEKKSGND